MFRPLSFLIGLLAATPPAYADAIEGRASSAEILEASQATDWREIDQENLLYITLNSGVVVVALSDQLAQGHVAQIKKLAREKFYDGLNFYRVIDGFVAQGGDVLEKRTVKTASKSLKAEFDQPLSDKIEFNSIDNKDGYAAQTGFVQTLPAGVDEEHKTIWLLHCAGAIAMARSEEKDSASTEFYIALQPQRYLDRNLTVFGRVAHGMEHIQALRRVAPAQSEDDDLGEPIISIRVGADLPETDRKKLQVLRSDTKTFQDYVEARRNRPDSFFYHRPDYINVCDLPVPVREVVEEEL